MLHILLPLSFVFFEPPTLPDTFPGEAPVMNDPVRPEGAVDTAPTQEVPQRVDPIENELPPELLPAREKPPAERRPTMAERYRQRQLEAGSPSPDHSEIRGAMLEFGLGLGGCWQAFCSFNPLSVLAHGGLGYRHGRIALVARVMGGGGPRTDLEGSLRIFGLDVGIELFPLRNPSFDPYFGIGLGYLRVTDVGPINIDQGTFDSAQIFMSQGGIRASAGWPFLLGERWALGPRLDYVWGFSGDFCASIAGSEADCISASSLVNQLAGPAKADRRAVRRTLLPRPWVLGLELRRRF